MRGFLVDLSDSLLKFMHRLHQVPEAFTEAALACLQPGYLQVSDPRQDLIQLFLHLPLLLQFSQQRLSGRNLRFEGFQRASDGRLQPQQLLEGGRDGEKVCSV